jgi:hypothetical protein
MRLADLARERPPSAKLADADAPKVAFFEGQRPNCPAAHSVLNVPADSLMPAAIFRVLRPFVVALAMIVTAASAHAQGVPTVTLPIAGTLIPRDQPTRPTGQQPFWVSRADCLAQDNFYFTVTLASYQGFTLQVWAANAGVDCTPVEQRQGTAAQCWNVYSAAAQTQITTVKIPATTLVTRAIPGMPPPSTDLRTICTGTGSPKGQQLNLTFLFVQSGATIAMGSTPQLWKDIGYDITAPAPPINIAASPGETRLHMSWTQTQDGDTFQYRFYCDPPPGSVLPDGGLNPMNFSSWGTVSQAQVATGGTAGFGGTSGAGGFLVDTGGSSGTAGVTVAGGSAGVTGAGGAGGTAGAVNAGGSSASGAVTGAGGDNTASCNASSVLVGGIDPTYPDSLDNYVCGTVGGLGISTGSTIEGLVNNVQYAVAMAAVDQVGNVGVLSPAVCATPAEVTDFFELYRAVGGKGGGGLCSLSRTRYGAPLVGILSASGLLAFAGAVRRARRRRK